MMFYHIYSKHCKINLLLNILVRKFEQVQFTICYVYTLLDQGQTLCFTVINPSPAEPGYAMPLQTV